jgi:RNA polymerase sigma-70 factor (ECF subfamily)
MNKKRSPDNQMTDPETWVDKHGDYLYRYALSRIHDPEIAEDLVQDTFLAALHGREKFEGRSSERTWLTAILKHKILDHLRKISREQPIDPLESQMDSLDDLFDDRGRWKVGPAKWTINPLKLFEQKAFWEVFSRCLSELPARSARTFKLREMDGLNCDEICKILNVSTTNCYVMLYRVRMFMRQCLEVNWLSGESVEDP